MCDEITVKENEEYLKKRGLSRRTFGAVASAAILTTSIGACAASTDVLEIVEQEVDVPTPDGLANCYFACPAKQKHPAVLVWPDIMGLRPAFRQMGKHLARAGYAVLVVNPYYRQTRGPVIERGESFQDKIVRERIIPFARALSAQTNVVDAKAFVSYLDAQTCVDTSKKIGTTGYCMGGSMTMRAAAALPERIGAGASFHGGRLVTDKENSPHLLVPKMKANFLFAIAQNDDERDPDAKDALRAAFDEAKRSAEIEVYEGTRHGWCPPDSAVHHEVQAARAHARLLHLLKTSLT